VSDRTTADSVGEASVARELYAPCGDVIDTTEWHPVVALADGDEFNVYPFCEEACRDDWREH
jgi:hypothetical protein